MLHGSGIYIVSSQNLDDFLNEVTKTYPKIESFNPLPYAKRYFDENDTHKIMLIGEGAHDKKYNNHECKKLSWINPASKKATIEKAKRLAKSGCKYANNIFYIYEEDRNEAIYKLLNKSYNLELAYSVIKDKLDKCNIINEEKFKQCFMNHESYDEAKKYLNFIKEN